jgi:hypothetical protein
MINEAFWLVYLANTFSSLAFALGLLAVVMGAFSAVVVGVYVIEEAEPPPAFLWRVLAAAALAGLVAVALPTKEAFYAGSAQYVVELTEIDESALALKKMLDAKIEELGAAE